MTPRFFKLFILVNIFIILMNLFETFIRFFRETSVITTATLLTDGYTEWIFSHCPANPTATLRQYWMCCQADRWVHRVNIRSLSSWSDCDTQTIFDVLLGWSMGTRAEHESWPTGFPRFYFLIYNMNTYSISLKKIASKSYSLGPSVANKSII